MNHEQRYENSDIRRILTQYEKETRLHHILAIRAAVTTTQAILTRLYLMDNLAGDYTEEIAYYEYVAEQLVQEVKQITGDL